MLTLITGVPGSGKTAGAVDLILKEYQGRPLYVDGLADLKLDHTPLDVMAWPSDVPDGAVVVVDEVQRKWRPRGPGSKVPESVAALETHRHRGLDFVIITQNPRLVDSNVRALVGRHVHIRDTGFMGRWAYEWPECNADLAWAKCQNKRRYKLPKRVFDLYTSASLHTKPVRKVPPMLYIIAALLVGIAALLYFLRSGLSEPEKALAPVLSATGTVLPAVPEPQPPQKPAFIDDRVDFIPRVSDKPESAPAYDAIRVIVNMPQVTGAACFKGACKCYTQQGTDTGLTHDACKAWMVNPTFDHYRLPPPPPATGVVSARAGTPSVHTPSAQGQTAPAPEQVVSIPFPSGYSNPRADARPALTLPPGSPVHTTPAKDAVQPISPPNLLNPYRRS